MSDLLSGIRVLESAVLLNGGSLGMYLADLGADVIKIESPQRGDYIRNMLGQITPGNSPAHLQVNKNKRSITLDLKSDAGLDVFWDLLSLADVFVDGFVGGSAEKLGIGYLEQRKRQPRIVYCHYSGYGRTGPYSSIPTHGQMMNAEAAAISLRKDADGFVKSTENMELMKGTSLGGDGTAAGAIHAAFYVASALFRREISGQGCFVDVSAADAVISQGWIGAVYGLNESRISDRTGLRDTKSAHQTGAKYQYYETSDENFVLFCCIELKFWRTFCEAVDRGDLAAHQIEPGVVDFARDDQELRHELQAIFSTRTQREWIQLAIEYGIPIGPANQGVASLRGDQHLAARQILFESKHPKAGAFTYVGEPALVDDQEYALRMHAPVLGQQTDELLRELGYSDDRIRELRDDGVV